MKEFLYLPPNYRIAWQAAFFIIIYPMFSLLADTWDFREWDVSDKILAFIMWLVLFLPAKSIYIDKLYPVTKMKNKVEIEKLTLASIVYHPIWGEGNVTVISPKQIQVQFSGCIKTFANGSHVVGDDIVDHLYTKPLILGFDEDAPDK